MVGRSIGRNLLWSRKTKVHLLFDFGIFNGAVEQKCYLRDNKPVELEETGWIYPNDVLVQQSSCPKPHQSSISKGFFPYESYKNYYSFHSVNEATPPLGIIQLSNMNASHRVAFGTGLFKKKINPRMISGWFPPSLLPPSSILHPALPVFLPFWSSSHF